MAEPDFLKDVDHAKKDLEAAIKKAGCPACETMLHTESEHIAQMRDLTARAYAMADMQNSKSSEYRESNERARGMMREMGMRDESHSSEDSSEDEPRVRLKMFDLGLRDMLKDRPRPLRDMIRRDGK